MAALRETEKEIARLQAEVRPCSNSIRICYARAESGLRSRFVAQTESYINENQAEANELMAEYWRLRSQVGQYMSHSRSFSSLNCSPEMFVSVHIPSAAEAYMTEMRAKLGLDG